MRVIKAAIVEDERAESDLLQSALARYGQEKKIQFEITLYESGEAFLKDCTSAVDIVFMDIEFPTGRNGMQTAIQYRRTNQNAILIFVTNIKKYAIKGYEVGALNYILKPIKYFSFAMTMDRAIHALAVEANEPVRIKTSDGDLIVDSRDILYVEVMKHDITVHTFDHVYYSYGTLSEWEELLTRYQFSRCSSSTLVNLRHIQKVHADDVEINGATLRIGRSKKKTFMKDMFDYLGEKV